MKNVLFAATDELRACIDHIAAERGVAIGPLLEELLRGTAPIKAAKKTLGFEWQERNRVGAAGHKKNAAE